MFRFYIVIDSSLVELAELSRQLIQLESDDSEGLITKQESVEHELVRLEDTAESYIRDLLDASGLHFGSWDKYLSRGDTFTKPIGKATQSLKK